LAIDREATLKNAEKFLRVGRLDAAIAEYARVVEDQPRDWNSANALGDLYVRAAQADQAIVLYRRIAEHLLAEGFYPRAAALFKKILKIVPDDEAAQLRLGEISARQGLMADAKAYYSTIASRRRQRGDEAGADEITIRLGTLLADDLDARLAAARAAERTGQQGLASQQYFELYELLLEQGREEDAFAALADCARSNPEANGVAVLLPLASKDLREGRLDPGGMRLREALATDPNASDAILELARRLAVSNVRAAVTCGEILTDGLIAGGKFAEAASLLQELAPFVPGDEALLLRLVEVCVDGGLEETMYEAQARLADAYLAGGRFEEARVIAEDLVAREPQNPAHVARLRRGLEMLGVEDVDAVIAARTTLLSAPDPVPVSSSASMAEAPPHTGVEPSPPPASMEIDLTTLLGELEGVISVPEPSHALATPPEDLEEVFERLRAETAEDPADESGEYFELARTYLDMDMPDEAVGALEMAARSPRHRFSAAAMLAQIYRDRSDLTQAVEWFERAAEAPAPGVEASRALLYDLGEVLETLGETARALAVFLELESDAPGYRDVAERVRRLSRVETEG
jgi:tetratricopeptide (TPR) repeat protein